MDRASTVRKILGAWISKQYEGILPLLDANVIYIVGKGAAESICHTPGVFVGKAKVEQWYNSHTVVAALHGDDVVAPMCETPNAPDVFTFEDSGADMITAMGVVGTNVAGEMPCTWMSLWHFNDELVDFMLLTADSVGGLEPFKAFRQKKLDEYHAGEFGKAKELFERFGSKRS